MNKVRRAKVANAITMIEEIRDEEQDSHDQMGAGLQESASGLSVQDNIAWLDGAIAELENIE